MHYFNERLKDLMKYETSPVTKFCKNLGIKNTRLFYCWLNGDYLPKLDYALKLADYFNISLDYLFGRTEDFSKAKFKQTPPFDTHFKEFLKTNKITQYRLIKEGICNFSNFYSWFKLKATPKMESLIRIADYLGVSLDYLVGRE